MLNAFLSRLGNRRLAYCLGVLLLFIAWPAQSQTNNTIYACYEKNLVINTPRGFDCVLRGELPGDLRRVSSPVECDPKKEIAVSWNIQGPMGPAGPQGPKGDTGPRGLQGATGAQGVKGDTGAAGAQGTPGVKGDKGADGISPIGTLEPMGPNCQYGGLKYTDAQGAQYICNGASGPQGLPGPPANTDALEARLTTLERATLPVAYVTNYGGGQVSVIDWNNTVFASLPIGSAPIGVALNSSSKRAYVANNTGGAVTIIDTATNAIIGAINGFIQPYAVATNPSADRIYVTSVADNALYVADTSSNNVVAHINGLNAPVAVVVNARIGQRDAPMHFAGDDRIRVIRKQRIADA